jgi:hypothetical protein
VLWVIKQDIGRQTVHGQGILNADEASSGMLHDDGQERSNRFVGLSGEIVETDIVIGRPSHRFNAIRC